MSTPLVICRSRAPQASRQTPGLCRSTCPNGRRRGPQPQDAGAKPDLPRREFNDAARATRTMANRSRRPVSDAVLHAPQRLRALVRARRDLACRAGGVRRMRRGLMVMAMTQTTQLVHQVLFGIGPASGCARWRAADPGGR